MMSDKLTIFGSMKSCMLQFMILAYKVYKNTTDVLLMQYMSDKMIPD